MPFRATPNLKRGVLTQTPFGRGWTAAGAFTSRSGTGEGPSGPASGDQEPTVRKTLTVATGGFGSRVDSMVGTAATAVRAAAGTARRRAGETPAGAVRRAGTKAATGM